MRLGHVGECARGQGLGSGTPKREFHYSDDMAEVGMSLMRFREKAFSRLAALGWQLRIGLREGIVLAYRDYLARKAVA